MILDTNALSAWAEGEAAIEPILQVAERLVIPVVVLGEYYFGIRQSHYRDRYERWLSLWLPKTEIVLVNHRSSECYADIRLQLKMAGTPIPQNDCWIAAQARQHDLPVVSRDTHFDHVTGLKRIDF